MNAKRILPDLQCSLLCEEVRQEINGNFIIVGVLSSIRVPRLPVTAYRLTVFNRWSSGLGQFIEAVRLIAPDQQTVLRRSELRFTLEEAFLCASNVTVFPQVELKAPGNYYIEVLVDEVLKLRYPVPVVVVPPPDKAKAAQPAGPPQQS
ncbi:MAG: hypothetical protein NZ739_06790 [Verrucomicrobiae bacterium]|nr:hypothetical protein [Verrucomicrobiae bacterium]MCX7722181.1 hypothetical protein [Verrucomicrobiae bacterium]MDW7979326.1 hypothetical protein [Verrucomicrobiales bacterium]